MIFPKLQDYNVYMSTNGEKKNDEVKKSPASFRKFATKTSKMVGSSRAFMFAILIVLVWAITGPAFGFSNTWQLVINTGTTIVTFLMVFLIQNTQNRDTKAINLKLDELIRAVKGARMGLVNLENLTDDELQILEEAFKEINVKYSGRISELKENLEELRKQEKGDNMVTTVVTSPFKFLIDQVRKTA